MTDPTRHIEKQKKYYFIFSPPMILIELLQLNRPVKQLAPLIAFIF